MFILRNPKWRDNLWLQIPKRVSLPDSYRRWFRGTFIGIGSVEVFFAIVTMLQGPKQVMSQFGIPTWLSVRRITWMPCSG